MDTENDGYLVEFVVIGNSVKATAFDPETLLEASVVGARSTTKKQLAKLAVKKLEYRIRKESDRS